MANVSEKFGLRPYRKLDGTPLVGAQNRYTIASGLAGAIFQGEMVEPLTSGNIQRHGPNTSDAVLGVFNGCFYTDPTTKKPTFSNYYPGGIAASDITAFVIDDPDAVFLIDADAAFTRADLYKNYSVTNTTGVTQTGISKQQLDVSVSGTALPTINTNLITSAVGSVLTGTTVTGNTLTSAVGSVSLQLSPVAAVSGTTVTSTKNFVASGGLYMNIKMNQAISEIKYLKDIFISASATILSIMIGVPAGRALGMYKFKGKEYVELLILAPTIVPGIAVVLGIHSVFISIGLTNTIPGVILVHLIPTLPYMTLVMSGIFSNFDPDFESQARSLGASPLKTFYYITLPSILPGIIVGGLFAFLVSWSQYILTLMIGGGRVITLPLLLFSFATSGRNDITGAIGMIYILPGIIILILTARHLSGQSAVGGFGRI